ncbi:MAG: SRPBCC domain-containing protein [Verrucomicrobiota bacterium]|jgi:uncharacterized protein YndB with AHSA1/START domain
MKNTTSTSTERPFVISHLFHAPRERLWKAWTERDRLMRWFGPAGVTIPVARLDFRPGGSFHFCMRTPDGKSMWGRFVYREINAPAKIVLVNSFSDEHGSLTRHPLRPTWPLEMLSTISLVDAGDYTKLTIEWLPLNPTDEERNTFDSSHDSMRQGWSGTFGQLTGYLVNA